MTSSRNKTITTSVDDGKAYLQRCRRVTTPVHDLADVIDATIVGDTFVVCPLLPKNSVDLVIVDPPYNLTKAFGVKTFKRMTMDDYAAYTEHWLTTVIPLLKPTSTVYTCCDWTSSAVIAQTLNKHLNLRNRITWQREKGRGAKTNWKNGLEDIYFATMSDQYVFNLDAVKVRRKVIAPYKVNGQPKDWVADGGYRDTCPSNFWDDITVPFWSMPENTAHPTQKPEKLIAKLMLASSNPGYVVLDPFLGSGTTSVVAKKLGRHYVGIEQNEQYCVWAEQRLAMADEDQRIQGYVDHVFRERNSAPT